MVFGIPHSSLSSPFSPFGIVNNTNLLKKDGMSHETFWFLNVSDFAFLFPPSLPSMHFVFEADSAIKGLDLLETITRNTAQNPKEEKYRKVRTSNEKLKAFFDMPGHWVDEVSFFFLRMLLCN